MPAIFAILISSCSGNPQTVISREAEESKIYSVLLNEDPKGYIGNSPVISIFNETEISFSSLSHEEKDILEVLPTLNKETLANYQEVNLHKKTIQLTLSLNKPYEIINMDEAILLEKENPNFLNTGSFVWFSGIGFNNRFDQALVYMENICGTECATGNFYLLIRDKDMWEIEGSFEGWIESP
jgi:hypothetical protein